MADIIELDPFRKLNAARSAYLSAVIEAIEQGRLKPPFYLEEMALIGSGLSQFSQLAAIGGL